jgi:hypothetical protein
MQKGININLQYHSKRILMDFVRRLRWSQPIFSIMRYKQGAPMEPNPHGYIYKQNTYRRNE